MTAIKNLPTLQIYLKCQLIPIFKDIQNDTE